MGPAVVLSSTAGHARRRVTAGTVITAEDFAAALDVEPDARATAAR
jgi:hypothetical protein